MGRESRIYFRLNCSFSVRFQINDGARSKTLSARAIDISTNGIGFLTPQKLENGQKLNLEFRLPGMFKKFHTAVIIRRQADQGQGKNLYFTGVQFEDIDESSLKTISNYIARKTRFTTERITSLILSLPLSLLILSRLFAMTLLHDFSLTPAGREWLGRPWTSTEWLIYSGAHLGATILLAPLSAGVFIFLPLGRQALAGISFILFASQGFRLWMKKSFLLQDTYFQGVFGIEILTFILSGALFIVLARPAFAKGFDVYLKNLRSHAEHGAA